MLRFLLFVISAGFGAGGFWSLMPLLMAHSIELYLPYGYESLSESFEFRVFIVLSLATLGPLSVIAATRIGRRMHFGATDGRPALLGWAGAIADAPSVYARRMLGSLLVAIASAIFATVTAWAIASKLSWAPPQLFVLYACLAFTLGLVAAIEFNDLRRTAKSAAFGLGA